MNNYRPKQSVMLFSKGNELTLYVSETEAEAVHIAARNLASDVEKVCNCDVSVKTFDPAQRSSIDSSKPNIIIITSQMESSAERFLLDRKIDIKQLKSEDGKYRWEAYLQQMAGQTLFLTGADRRGTVYAIYDLSEKIGVSPWYYWGDVPVKEKNSFHLPEDYLNVDWPSIPYRGVFLNDEEQLYYWSRNHTKDDTIGPETYERIFELILRLKANYIWPAMHTDYFNRIEKNRQLADKLGIILGTSHPDMLMRSNQNEWDPWVRSKGYDDLEYDYSIPGENRNRLQEYWRESVKMYKDQEVSYTLGMRGIHDFGFSTRQIDEDTTLSESQKERLRVELLGQIIKDQKQMLKDVLSEEIERETLKLFIPYKEVLPLYDDGLDVPENVTLVWVNDNFGNVRRYPDDTERKRSGGNGLYYHASYWAPKGMSYLFFNTIPLAKIGNELKKSYQSGIRKLWVLNIGALKPLEIDIDYFLRYAWQAGKENADTNDVIEYAENWFSRNFQSQDGKEFARIYNEFLQVNNVCKLEHFQSGKFSEISYGDEWQRRLHHFKELFDRANAIYHNLEQNERDAFFEMILLKFHAAYFINASFCYADRSRLAYDRGAMQAADSNLNISRKFDELKRELIYYFNHKMSAGKWNGILTPETFPPPTVAMYPAGKPALKIGSVPGLGLFLSHDHLCFSKYGKQWKHFDLYNIGKGSIDYKVEAPEWLDVTDSVGSITDEKRIVISINNSWRDELYRSGAQGKIRINGGGGERYDISVQIETAIDLSQLDANTFHVEADDAVSILASELTHSTHTNEARWEMVEHMGRGSGHAIQASNDELTSFIGELIDTPRIEYTFYLESKGAFLLEIFRFLTLNSTGQIRFGIGIDDQPPFVLQSEITDELRGEWVNAVMNDGEKMYCRLPYLNAGLHTLKIHMIDNYVTFTKFVIYTSAFKSSNLGPEPSCFFVNGTQSDRLRYDENLDISNHIPNVNHDLYRTTIDEVPLLPVPYAYMSYWAEDHVFENSQLMYPTKRGAKKYLTNPDGTKDSFKFFGSGVFHEQNGILAIEPEYALENSSNAYLTGSILNDLVFWTHTQSETNGQTGLAMTIEQPGHVWDKPETAPGMHYRIKVKHGGIYHIWLLSRFEDDDSDSAYIALDGNAKTFDNRPIVDQYFNGELFSYPMKQIWNWSVVANLEITPGMHTFSILGRNSGFKIDRIYLTLGEETPPLDENWVESQRK